MSDTKQPEALQLADACAGDWEAVRAHLVVQMLRDHHARIAELEAQLLKGELTGQAAPAHAVAVTHTVTIDFKQATELLAMFGGEPAEITLMTGDGHSGNGLYASYTDMPEEGAGFLGTSDNEAMPAAQAQEHATQLAGRGQAIPGDCPHLIWYDDADRKPEMLAGHGARDAALKRFKQISWQLNAHLFVRIAKNSRHCPYPVAAAAPAQAHEDARDTERLDFMIESGAKVETVAPNDRKYLNYPNGLIQVGAHRTARAAIDAARAAQGGAA